MKISIVTVVLNDRLGLEKTRNSVKGQLNVEIEHIIIDGASSDGTAELAFEYLKDQNINSVVRSERDHGLYDAMNKGVELATGDYIIFLNAGDYFAESDVLSTVVTALDGAPGTCLLYGSCYELRSDGQLTHKIPRGHSRVKSGMFANHQAMFFNRKFVVENNIKYDIKYKIGGDYAYCSQLIKFGGVIEYLGVPICVFEMSGISNTRKSIGRADNWRIQRDILGVGLIERVANQVRYIISAYLSDAAPSLYARIRYERKS